MGCLLFRAYRKLLLVLAAPVYLAFFFRREVGRDHGVGLAQKLRLIAKFRSNTHKIATASHWGEHLRIAAEILRLPRSAPGDVIECGCFKGGSTANLSIACALAGRRLIVCDSFQGLPEPGDGDKVHTVRYDEYRVTYEKGGYRGGLEEVKANVRRYGRIEACEFVKGYFEQTLPGLEGDYALAFLDVDLTESLKTCLTCLWPRLLPGAYLFSHEAEDLAFTALFFDRKWWSENLVAEPPGFVGAGSGLPARVGEGSALGYAVKRAKDAAS